MADRSTVELEKAVQPRGDNGGRGIACRDALRRIDAVLCGYENGAGLNHRSHGFECCVDVDGLGAQHDPLRGLSPRHISDHWHGNTKNIAVFFKPDTVCGNVCQSFTPCQQDNVMSCPPQPCGEEASDSTCADNKDFRS